MEVCCWGAAGVCWAPSKPGCSVATCQCKQPGHIPQARAGQADWPAGAKQLGSLHRAACPLGSPTGREAQASAPPGADSDLPYCSQAPRCRLPRRARRRHCLHGHSCGFLGPRSWEPGGMAAEPAKQRAGWRAPQEQQGLGDPGPGWRQSQLGPRAQMYCPRSPCQALMSLLPQHPPSPGSCHGGLTRTQKN